MKTQQKTFYLKTIYGFEQAEKYKAKHENAGATVRTKLSPLNDKVTIKVTYPLK